MTRDGSNEKFSEFLRLVGSRIRSHRQALGLSIEALALRSGIAQSFLGQMERGAKLSSLHSLYKVAQGLRAQPVELLAVESETQDMNVVRELAALLRDRPKEERLHLFRVFREIARIGEKAPSRPKARRKG